MPSITHSDSADSHPDNGPAWASTQCGDRGGQRTKRSSPINVLYVLPHGEMGGAERFLDAVFSWHRAPFKPIVLLLRSGSWLEQLRQRGLPVYCIDSARLRRPFLCFREISRIIRAEHVDIVHSSYAWCHTLATPAAIISGCKRVWFQHGPLAERTWQGLMPLVPADLLLVNSHFTLSRLRQTLYWAKKVGVVHLGVDWESFVPNVSRRERFRRQWGIDEDTLAIGIVGFLDVWKGQDVFLRAAKLLSRQPLGLRMFVVGGPRGGKAGPRCRAYEKELRDYVSANNLGQIVTFTGHLDVNDGALDGLDIFVHSSTQPEPFGMAILEAMAKGKAVIASAEGGPCEILEDGVDGLLVEPRSPEKLSTAIIQLAGDVSLRNRIGIAALAKARSRFSSAAATRKLETWYDQIL
jgi:glycosyltransferase involved in cell wall biosynthesis